MKIGILTFHRACNYGAVLQAFALQEFLKSCRHEVEFIDYRSRYMLDVDSVFPVRWIVRRLFRRANRQYKNSIFPKGQKNLHRWGKLSWFIKYSKDFIPRALLCITRQRAFKDFVTKKLNLSRERFSEGDAFPQRYDAIIFGSDQIWNSEITGGDPIYVGNFPTDEKTLKIAYATSAGGATETIRGNKAFLNALKNFDAISVRERDLADAMKQNFEGEIKVVLDPTFLVEKSLWDKIAISPKHKRKYVLVYVVLLVPEVFRIARELAEQIDADVVSVGANYWNRPKGDLVGETPEQFVGWFKNATCVVTTSFHGTAFSIIYEKPLYYVSKDTPAGNRASHLLRELGLSDHIVTEDSHPKFSEINYSNSKVCLESLRIESRKFLEMALATPTSVGDPSP